METRQKIQTYYTNSGLALAIRHRRIEIQSGDKKCEVVCQFGESNPDKKFSFLLKIFYWIRKEVKRIRSRIQKSLYISVAFFLLIKLMKHDDQEGILCLSLDLPLFHACSMWPQIHPYSDLQRPPVTFILYVIMPNNSIKLSMAKQTMLLIP